MQGARVQSLVGELTSHMPHGGPKNLKKEMAGDVGRKKQPRDFSCTTSGKMEIASAPPFPAPTSILAAEYTKQSIPPAP